MNIEIVEKSKSVTKGFTRFLKKFLWRYRTTLKLREGFLWKYESVLWFILVFVLLAGNAQRVPCVTIPVILSHVAYLQKLSCHKVNMLDRT